MTFFTLDDLYPPSRWLKACDIPNGVAPATIVHVDKEKMRNPREGGETLKATLQFKEFDKRLILRTVHIDWLKDAFGPPQNWIGKRIELVVRSVEVGGKPQDAIRFGRVLPDLAPPPSVASNTNSDDKTEVPF
jgi:hypothetical protein